MRRYGRLAFGRTHRSRDWGVRLCPAKLAAGRAVFCRALRRLVEPAAFALGRIAVAAIVLAFTYGSLLPWAYRNSEVTGHWIWTTLWVGPSLYDGLNPQATGESDMQFFERDRLMDRMTEFDVDRYYRDKAWQFVRDHPGKALSLTVDKIARFWMPWPNAEQFSGLGLRFAIAVYFIPWFWRLVLGWVFGPRNYWGLGPDLGAHPLLLGDSRRFSRIAPVPAAGRVPLVHRCGGRLRGTLETPDRAAPSTRRHRP